MQEHLYCSKQKKRSCRSYGSKRHAFPASNIHSQPSDLTQLATTRGLAKTPVRMQDKLIIQFAAMQSAIIMSHAIESYQ